MYTCIFVGSTSILNHLFFFRQNKNQMVFWIVSHCTTVNYREKYVEALQNYVPVNVFGQCNKKPCPRGTFDDCHKVQSISHKFYIAFENSNCQDYITEKLWKALNMPVVPVVMGGGNYLRDAPPHSFIDVKNFEDVQALAEYLIFLDENDVSLFGNLKNKMAKSTFYNSGKVFGVLCLEGQVSSLHI